MSEVKVNKISPRTNCGTVTVGDSGDSVSVSAGVPVTVNGDLKSNALKATDGGSIISQSGTTITIGASGDTVSLASGASQSGFGRAGSVDWQTGSIKTADFTAANGEGYFVNTTSGAVTVTLPSSPSAGNIVAIADYAGTAATNNITINRNSSPFEGGTQNGQIITNRQVTTLVYVDGTQGWISTAESDSSFQTPAYVTATGGTITTSGDFKIHTFTGPGTFCVSCAGNVNGNNKVDYLVVAGGGGGAGGGYFAASNGGGGAGGFREAHCASVSGPYTASPLASSTSLPVTVQGYPVTVGAGGVGVCGPNNLGNNGANSVFSTITSTGGGGGGSQVQSRVGQDGGSGGGGGSAQPGPRKGAGNTPPVSPPQGNPGGDSPSSGGGGPAGQSSGGGGGATQAGQDGPGAAAGGNGGNGGTTNIPGSPITKAGGGGGGGSVSAGSGGSGGGGGAGAGCQGGTSASANTGSGGGGGASNTSSIPYKNTGGSGGSGIVVIRYKFQN